jgi:Amidohydrolase
MNVVQPIRGEKGATPIGLDADSHGTEHRAIVDTHRHWISRDLLKVSTGDALKFLNDEYLEIKDRFPGEFELMANAHALEEGCRPVVEEMISKGDAKAIAVASSYGDGSERAFLDSPKAEWLWEFAEANDIVVHIHPPMVSLGHESLMLYRLNEAVGRPFDSTVNVARMIGSGVFDRHPKLQVLVVHMGGGLASILGRLDFNWHLNYDGIPKPPTGRPYTNLRKPSEYCKTRGGFSWPTAATAASRYLIRTASSLLNGSSSAARATSQYRRGRPAASPLAKRQGYIIQLG